MEAKINVRVEIDALKLAQVCEKIAETVEPKLEACAAEVEATAVQLLSKAYPPSSSPGEAPHVRSGNLKHSISHLVARHKSAVVALIGSRSPYARRLELGDSRTAPRPFLRPALEHAWPRIVEIFGGKKVIKPI